MNAYITTPITEWFWTILRPKVGAEAGKKAIKVCALYALKSAGATFWYNLCIYMRGLDYQPCLYDPDLWYKDEVQPDDGFE